VTVVTAFPDNPNCLIIIQKITLASAFFAANVRIKVSKLTSQGA
jgi:hypothetical protein